MELDLLSGIYDGTSAYQFDNKIILDRYPKQVLKKYSGRGSLLELGLGHGFSAQAFSKKFDSHTVIEGSLKVIEQHASLLRENNIKVVHSYFENFEPEEKYDLIIAGFVLEHVEDPELIVRKYLKFLSTNGLFVIAVPNSDSLNRRIGFHAGLLDDMELLSKHDKELGHLRYFNCENLVELIEVAEGTVTFMEGIFLKVASSIQLQEMQLESAILESYCEVAINYPELSCAILAGITPNSRS
jgi:2-polyprenyl-3-methyl-5-hydroxy-6-metoxy-1,4-benzoquinol methylase